MHNKLPLFDPLPTPSEMRLWDKIAINDYGMPAVMLIENASRSALEVLKKYISCANDTRILVFSGRGSNGGDGIALARHLHNIGCQVVVYLVDSLENLTDAVSSHVQMARKAGVLFLDRYTSNTFALPAEWNSPDIIIDALTGTGLKGELRKAQQAIIKFINNLKRHTFIFSLDIPSGLCGLTGKPKPIAIEADATVSFEAGKPGLFFPESKRYTGTVHVCPIGLPRAILETTPPSWQLISPKPGAWAQSPAQLHKGKAGKIIIIGGSRGIHGAPLLASLGALRTGAGLVTLFCPANLDSIIKQGYPEVMTQAIGSGDYWESEMSEEILHYIDVISPSAIIIGPGMGKSSGVSVILKSVLSKKNRCAVVIDADALHHIQFPLSKSNDDTINKNNIVNLLQKKDVLTPHPGEMASMLSSLYFSKMMPTSKDIVSTIQTNRADIVKDSTSTCSAVIVLKGAGTLVAQQKKPISLSSVDCPVLSVGGSGDVLSGIIGALIAQSYSSYDAACLAVYLHAQAGIFLEKKAPRGFLASEIATSIPFILANLTTKNEKYTKGKFF